MLLNLANLSAWLRAAKDVAARAIPVQMRKLLRGYDPQEMHPDTLDYLIQAGAKTGVTIYAEELREVLDRSFLQMFTTIKGFHACRIIDEKTYRIRGLQALNEQLLLNLALERFSGYVSKDTIEKVCRDYEIRDCGCGVYFFGAFKHVPCARANHYLKSGSETMRELSQILGVGNRGILASQGRSCAIECDIPLAQVSVRFRYEFWTSMITFHFRSMAGEEYAGTIPHWSYATVGSVAPECLRRFHYFADSEYDYRLTFLHW